jgi:hypothetical protein
VAKYLYLNQNAAVCLDNLLYTVKGGKERILIKVVISFLADRLQVPSTVTSASANDEASALKKVYSSGLTASLRLARS